MSARVRGLEGEEKLTYTLDEFYVGKNTIHALKAGTGSSSGLGEFWKTEPA